MAFACTGNQQTFSGLLLHAVLTYLEGQISLLTSKRKAIWMFARVVFFSAWP